MTGAGAPGAAGIIRCLKQDNRIRIVLADKNPDAVGRFLNGNFHVIPDAGDPQFIASIRSICLREKIDVLMPLVTRELNSLAAMKDEFRTIGVQVLVSDENALSIANDKGRLYQHLEMQGIDLPKYRLVKTAEEFVLAVNDLDYPHRKICFKPCVSNGSRGFRILDPSADEWHLLFHEKPNNTIISYDKAIELFTKHGLPPLLLSEYLPGPEYSIDCLAQNGKARVCVPRLRTKMKEGISVEGEFVAHKEIIAYAEEIIQALHLHGNIGIQVKQAEDGRFKILEINPRVQGTISAGLGAGINLPLLAVKQAMQWTIDEQELQVIWGTKFIRFWDEVFYT